MLIVKLQALWRGKRCRRNLLKIRDGMTFSLLKEFLGVFQSYYRCIEDINKELDTKKVRQTNFPSEISENIAKFAIRKKYKVSPKWENVGDLSLWGKKLEVKGFSSVGPSSFGPTESWDRLYFVDCTKFLEHRFKVYEIKLSNNNEIWGSMKMNKNETYKQQCIQKRRPRIGFSHIQRELGEHCKCIFNGHFDSLEN